MNTADLVFQQPWIARAGWTLVHFLWQGSVIVIGFAILRATACRTLKARGRYALSCAAFATMVVAPALTFLVASALPSPELPRAPWPVAATGILDRLLPRIVAAWLIGVVFFSTRIVIGWLVTARLKRRPAGSTPVEWQRAFEELMLQMRISAPARLLASARVTVPAVVGWLQPVILMPVETLAGLPAGHIRALLAHELAHIRRHDYLVNLVQTAIETLLFYHPAVWWVGRQMRAERENCCDDLAVAVCGDALVYARALTELEKIRIATPRLVMAANSGSLLQRVRRLLDPQRDPASSPSEIHADWVTGVAIVLCVVSIWATSGGPPRLRLDHAAQSVRLVNALYQQRPEPTASQVDQQVDQQVEQRVIQTPKAKLVAMAQPAAQAEQTAEPSSDKSFVGGIAALGYKDLSVDQLISLKIHGVTTDYVRELLAAGLKLKVDEIVSFAIHGAQPADIVEMQELGYKLTPNEIVSMYIHGLTPEFTRQMKSAGFGTPTFEQLVSFKIHGVTPEIAEQFKQAGVRELNFDKLVSLEIHGANPDTVKQIGALGYPNLTADDVIAMCIHGVDVDFVRKAQKHGFRDLSLDKLIKLKQYGILD